MGQFKALGKLQNQICKDRGQLSGQCGGLGWGPQASLILDHLG